MPIEEPLDGLESFVRYFTISYYTGTAKAIIDHVYPPAALGWYLGDHPLPEELAQPVHEEFTDDVTWDVGIKGWSAMQIEQKRIQMCSNGGRDPFPSTGFLEPWLELCKTLNRPPFQLLEAMMKKSLEMWYT